jgi:hypothetical protein
MLIDIPFSKASDPHRYNRQNPRILFRLFSESGFGPTQSAQSFQPVDSVNPSRSLQLPADKEVNQLFS